MSARAEPHDGLVRFACEAYGSLGDTRGLVAIVGDLSNVGSHLLHRRGNRYEVQIESPKGKDAADPYNWTIGLHGIGAFCMERVPDLNAWRPNGEWHSFHFIFKAARWDGDKMIEPARATVWWNGLKIHDNVAIKHANGGVKVGPSAEGLKLQEHGQDVRFRNIWIVDQTSLSGRCKQVKS